MQSEHIKGHLDGNDIKKGTNVVIDDRPYKVLDVRHVKPGKHGHAKTIIRAEDLFNQKKKDLNIQSGTVTQEPIVLKKEYDVIDLKKEINEHEEIYNATLFDPTTNLSSEMKIDQTTYLTLKTKMSNESETAVSVTVLESMGETKIIRS